MLLKSLNDDSIMANISIPKIDMRNYALRDSEIPRERFFSNFPRHAA